MMRKIFLAALSLAGLGFAIEPGHAASSTIPGTGAVSGTVTAPRSFTAAHVYLYNPEKRVTYMVYTRAGTYQAINLYPGEYEVRAARRGLASEPQKIKVDAGASLSLNIVL